MTRDSRKQYQALNLLMASTNDEENGMGNPDVGFAQPARQRPLEKQVFKDWQRQTDRQTDTQTDTHRQTHRDP